MATVAAAKIIDELTATTARLWLPRLFKPNFLFDWLVKRSLASELQSNLDRWADDGGRSP